MTATKSIRGPQIKKAGYGGRWYLWKRDRYWSVTTIISGGLPKPVLVNWAKKFTAEYAVANIEALDKLVEADPQGAIDWLKGAAFRDRDKKADLGSLVHEAVEAHVLGQPYPEWTEQQAPFMDAAIAFIADYDPTFLSVEAPCFSTKQKYAGTLDWIAEISTDLIPEEPLWGPTPVGRPWRILGDWKTGSGVYPEVALQLAAYRYSETFLGLPDGSEGPVPEVDGCAVVHLRPEGYKLIPVLTNPDVFDAFLFCREVFRFVETLSKEVIGDSLVPRGPEDPVEQMAVEVTTEGTA